MKVKSVYPRSIHFIFHHSSFILSFERKERELNPQGLRSAVFGTAAIAHWLALPYCYCLPLCQPFRGWQSTLVT